MEKNKLILLNSLIKERKFDEIYNYFGPNVFFLVTPKEYKKREIKRLIKEDNYGEIHRKYGDLGFVFIKELRVYSKKCLKKMRKENKYIEVQELLDEGVYSKEIETDVYNETGSKFKAKLYRNKFILTQTLKDLSRIAAGVVIASSIIFPGLFMQQRDNEYIRIYNENKEMIEKYDNMVNEYANEINELGLENHLDIIMKVLYDTSQKIEGYKTPTLDLTGAWRLDLLEENSFGVCRNLSDDFCYKMNAINSEYNARNLAVYLDSSKYSKEVISNVEIKNLSSTENDNLDESSISIDITKFTGNHMVSAINIPGESYTFIVDPTNPSIGVVLNNEIYLLSDKKNEGLEFKPAGQLLLLDTEVNKSVFSEFIKSFRFPSKEELNRLFATWGVDSQNEALQRVINLDKSKSK